MQDVVNELCEGLDCLEEVELKEEQLYSDLDLDLIKVCLSPSRITLLISLFIFL